jgi:hypothetical protein
MYRQEVCHSTILEKSISLTIPTTSLAMTEMRILMNDVYSRFKTTVSSNMTGDMTMDDQIISSRPKDQICLLDFEVLA